MLGSLSQSIPKDAQDPRWFRATLLLLFAVSLWRLPRLWGLELVPDEAYYWDWSRRPALGYYDQGPLVSYALWITTRLFGSGEFGVRIGVLLASVGTLLGCEALARRLFSPRAGFLTVLLLALTPLMEVGSIIATYDPFMVVFWAWTLFWLERALFSEGRSTQNRAWLLAGVFTGLGFLSKHTMLLILPCLVAFLLWSPAHRVWLRRPQPYLAFGICLLLYSGVFYWNAHHHWWTFGHLFFLAKKDFGAPLRRFGDFLGSQALLLGPALFLGTLGACVWGAGRRPKQERQESRSHSDNIPNSSTEIALWQRRFLVCCGLPVLLFFCLLTLKAKVQGNWAPCAWLSLTVLWAGALSAAIERGEAKAWRKAWASVVVSLFITVALISPSLRLALGVRLPPDADLSNTAYGWREMAERVQQERKALEREGKPVFISANSYQYAALLAYYLPDRPETFDLFLNFRLTMYAAYIERLRDHLGENALYVNDNKIEDPYLRQIFERVEWSEAIPVWRKPYSQEPIRQYYIARCYRYRKYTGVSWASGG